jgi:peptidylprolyl isomerase
MRAAAIAIVVSLVGIAGGCGGDDGSAGTATAAKPRTVDLGGGPPVEIPAGTPPRRLVVEDLRKGTGQVAQRGDELEVEYVGVFWNGRPFTNSWERSKPFEFVLGEKDIMITPAWHEGLEGMRVGGRRKLISPPRWQSEGAPPPESGPDDTLVYVIDLISIR